MSDSVTAADPHRMDLRSVFSIHPEPFTVVARADAGISNFEDLRGKRVNVGKPGSGQRATMEVLMDRMGWTMEDFSHTFELQAAEQSEALCDNNIDAMIYTVGHPPGSILLPVDLNDPEAAKRPLGEALALVGEGGVLHVASVMPEFGLAQVSGFFR